METIQDKKALEKTRRICSQKEQCSHDILLKLERWGISSETSRKIIAQLEREKFIDHSRYCEFFVADKLRINKWGKKKIEYVLRQKSIAPVLIESALEKIDPDEYLTILKTEIGKKRRGIKAKNQYDLKGKLFRFAQSKGFETELIYTVIEECISE
jgi:regulatory protein